MAEAPDIVEKLNEHLRLGKPMTLTVLELMQLADVVNGAVRLAGEHSAMLNLYVARREGQVSYQLH